MEEIERKSRYEKIKDGVCKSLKNGKVLTIIVLLIIFGSMLVFNFLTPLIADDYSYILTATGIKDIIKYEANQYMVWGGRFVAHVIAQFFLMYPKYIFNICNSLVYTLFIYLIYLIGKSKDDKHQSMMLVIIHLLIWFTTPVFGQNCLWLIGSCNYLWTTTIILLLILLYKKNSTKDGIARMISIFILGIVSGWTNENTSFGLIVILIGLTCISKILNKEKIRKWQISGILGAIVGFLILILAPGNFKRSQLSSDNTSIVVKIIQRGINYLLNIVDYLLPLIIISVILISIIIYFKKKKLREPIVYLIGAFFTVYAMVLSPEFPPRAWFGIIIFMILAIITMLFEVKKLHKIYNFILIDIMVVFFIIFASEYIYTAKDINVLRQVWNERKVQIEEALENGQKNVKFKIYKTTNSKNPQFELVDLNRKSTLWPNPSVAEFYGLEKIEAEY